MALEVISTMASVGCSMRGSGTSWTRTSSKPCHVTALMTASSAPVRGRQGTDRPASRGLVVPLPPLPRRAVAPTGSRRQRRGIDRAALVSPPAASAAGGEAGGHHLLALLRALAALVLRLAKELRELVVALALGVLDVRLESQGVAEARLREPDDVVVLVLGAGDVTGLGGAHSAAPFPISASFHALPATRAVTRELCDWEAAPAFLHRLSG